MYAVALIVGAMIGVFFIAILRAGDCEDCALKAYRDDEEGENK